MVLQAGNTLFTPRYAMRKCTAGLESADCKNNCIHWGRYCAMDSIGSQYADHFHGWQVGFTSPGDCPVT